MLRTGVLKGRTVALAGASVALGEHLEGLGAAVLVLKGAGSAAPFETEPARHAAAASQPSVDTLVADTRAAFRDAGGAYAGVRAAVDGAFSVTRGVALEHWIDRPGGGRAVLVAPAPGAGRHAGAAAAGLENLARTLSTEWARHQVTTVAVLPGDTTAEATLADLVAWVASPAGAYLSGTALTLDQRL